MISSLAGAVCCFAFTISVLMVAGKKFVLSDLDDSKSGYEGDGQGRMWQVSYGTTAQGLFSALSYVGLVVYHFQAYKAPSREKFNRLNGMCIFAAVMLLQAAIAYGDEALTANELLVNHGKPVGRVKDPLNYDIIEGCGITDAGTQCGDDWKCDVDVSDNCPFDKTGNYPLVLHIRTYAPNTAVKGPANAAVAFGVFMFLISLFQIGFLHKNIDEIAGGGGYMDISPNAPASAAAPAGATNGEVYQRL